MTLGLVTAPVALFAATEDHTVHFHQLQRGTSDRIRNKRVNELTGKEADTHDIVKGHNLGGADYVVVEYELLRTAPRRAGRQGRHRHLHHARRAAPDLRVEPAE